MTYILSFIIYVCMSPEDVTQCIKRFKNAEEALLKPRPADLTENQLNAVRTRRRLTDEQFNRLTGR